MPEAHSRGYLKTRKLEHPAIDEEYISTQLDVVQSELEEHQANAADSAFGDLVDVCIEALEGIMGAVQEANDNAEPEAHDVLRMMVPAGYYNSTLNKVDPLAKGAELRDVNHAVIATLVDIERTAGHFTFIFKGRDG